MPSGLVVSKSGSPFFLEEDEVVVDLTLDDEPAPEVQTAAQSPDAEAQSTPRCCHLFGIAIRNLFEIFVRRDSQHLSIVR
jgi:hypothetical protein